MVTKPLSFMASKEKRLTWRKPIARVVAALMRRSSTLQDSSSSFVTQNTVKSELVIESTANESKACVQVVEVESIPSSSRKSKEVKKEKSKKTKKPAKREAGLTVDWETSPSKAEKVETCLNSTTTKVSTDLDPVREETTKPDTKKTSTTRKTKKKKSTEGDKKSKKSKKSKKLESDDSKDTETKAIKKKKKKTKTSNKKKKKETKKRCTDVEKAQRHEEDSSLCSCGSSGLPCTSESNRHDLTPITVGISTRTEDSSIHSTASFLRTSNRSLMSTSERSRLSHTSRDDSITSPSASDTKPTSCGTLDEFFQNHQPLLDPLDPWVTRKQRSQEDGCDSLDLDDLFQSCNDTTTKSTTSSTEKTQGSSSHHRKSRLASPGRKGGRRTTLIADWTAPVDASLHWSSCHESCSFDFLAAPENSVHGSASITPTTVSKTSTKVTSTDSSHRITKLSDHDISTCDGEEFAEDMFDSDNDDDRLSDDELKESPSISLGRKSACRTISETSFSSSCIEEVRGAFDEGDAFSSDGDDKAQRSSGSSEIFEILQMTPRTRTKVISKRNLLAQANCLVVLSDH